MSKTAVRATVLTLLLATSQAFAFDPRFRSDRYGCVGIASRGRAEGATIEWIRSAMLDTDSRGDLLVSFGADGLYGFYNNTEWKLLLPVAPLSLQMLTLGSRIFLNTNCRPGDSLYFCSPYTYIPELLVDLGEDGVYILHNGTTWEYLFDTMPQHYLVADLDNKSFWQPDPHLWPDADCSGTNPQQNGACLEYFVRELIVSDGIGPIRALYNGAEWRNLGDPERALRTWRVRRSRMRDVRFQRARVDMPSPEIVKMGR